MASPARIATSTLPRTSSQYAAVSFAFCTAFRAAARCHRARSIVGSGDDEIIPFSGAATAGCLLNVAVGRAGLQHGGDASIPALVLGAADVQPTVSRRLFRRKAGQRETLF